MEVKVEWQGNMKFLGLNQSGKSILMDANIEAGGDGKGPSPMEVLLQAVAGCTGIDVVLTAKKMRMNITNFSLNLIGVKAEEHPHRFTDIEIIYNVEGDRLDIKKLLRTIDLSMNKYCSVSNSLSALFTTRLIVNGQAVEAKDNNL